MGSSSLEQCLVALLCCGEPFSSVVTLPKWQLSLGAEISLPFSVPIAEGEDALVKIKSVLDRGDPSGMKDLRVVFCVSQSPHLFETVIIHLGDKPDDWHEGDNAVHAYEGTLSERRRLSCPIGGT